MKCMVCGAEMTNSIGGNYHCPKCGFGLNDGVYRPQNFDMPIPERLGHQGWICPKCGRGVSPWVDYCSCSSTSTKSGTTSHCLVDFVSYLDILCGGNSNAEIINSKD